jgi:hypothetical protein
MTSTKIYSTAVIIATILVIAVAATATTSFPNVTSTVFATLQAPEQLGDNNATASTTTPTPPLVGGGGQGQQQQQTILITKASTNSYLLTGGLSRANIGSFDTTYTVVGERSAIRTAENLIISTITSDFRNSPTIGYISTGTPESPRSSPFATPEQVTERITNELRRAISEAETNRVQSQYWEIKCDFGMTLEEMRCHYVPSPGGITFLENLPLEPGGLAPTNTTNTTNTTDTTATISPLEGE